MVKVYLPYHHQQEEALHFHLTILSPKIKNLRNNSNLNSHLLLLSKLSVVFHKPNLKDHYSVQQLHSSDKALTFLDNNNNSNHRQQHHLLDRLDKYSNNNLRLEEQALVLDSDKHPLLANLVLVVLLNSNSSSNSN